MIFHKTHEICGGMRRMGTIARPAPHGTRGSVRASNAVPWTPNVRCGRARRPLVVPSTKRKRSKRGCPQQNEIQFNYATAVCTTPIHPSKQQNHATASGGRDGASSGAAQPSGSSAVPRDTDIKMDCSARFTTVSATPADTGGAR